jgi:hypothetical protein
MRFIKTEERGRSKERSLRGQKKDHIIYFSAFGFIIWQL